TVKKGDLLAQIDPRPFAIQAKQAAATIARDKAQLGAAKVNLDRYEAQRKEGVATQQQVDDWRAQVAQLEATVAADEATASNARLTLDYASIRSPLDGVTGVRLVDAGNVVRQNDPNGIVVITQLDPIVVFFSLPQDDLTAVQRELEKGPVSVEAY